MALVGKVAVFLDINGVEESIVNTFQKLNPSIQSIHTLRIPEDSDISQSIAQDLFNEKFDGIIYFNKNINMLSTELQSITNCLKDGGVLNVYMTTEESENNATLMAFMIGGLVEVEGAKVTDECILYPNVVNLQRFIAKKPAFTAGSSATISRNKTTQAVPLKKWTVTADEFADDEDELIDEETLLDDTDEVLAAAKKECAPGPNGKKRACKDCTCGLKDQEDQPVVSDADLSKMVSSCGNCYKGDAFRCGSCPFLGKPAFQPGREKVLLNLDDSDDF